MTLVTTMCSVSLMVHSEPRTWSAEYRRHCRANDADGGQQDCRDLQRAVSGSRLSHDADPERHQQRVVGEEERVDQRLGWRACRTELADRLRGEAVPLVRHAAEEVGRHVRHGREDAARRSRIVGNIPRPAPAA